MILNANFKENIIIDKADLYDIEIDKRSIGSLFIELKSDSNLNIHIQDSASLKLFLINRVKQSISININIEMDQDSNCQMGFLDLEDSNVNWKQDVILKDKGANFEILSGQLCMPENKKVCSMEVRHEAGYTTGQMKNFAVLLDKADYEMVANGNIKKACPEAASHQATRVLTLGQDHKAKVIPLLLIDENEVKASHALTIGQPDEEQLYYLQSRGLSTTQAMGLLSVGYFLPVIDLIEDEKLHDTIREEMESKVGLYGSK